MDAQERLKVNKSSHCHRPTTWSWCCFKLHRLRLWYWVQSSVFCICCCFSGGTGPGTLDLKWMWGILTKWHDPKGYFFPILIGHVDFSLLVPTRNYPHFWKQRETSYMAGLLTFTLRTTHSSTSNRPSTYRIYHQPATAQRIVDFVMVW